MKALFPVPCMTGDLTADGIVFPFIGEASSACFRNELPETAIFLVLENEVSDPNSRASKLNQSADFVGCHIFLLFL